MINAKAPAEMWFFFFFFAVLMALCFAMFIPVDHQDVPSRSYESGVPVQGDALEPRGMMKQTQDLPDAPARAPKSIATSPRPNKAVSQ